MDETCYLAVPALPALDIDHKIELPNTFMHNPKKQPQGLELAEKAAGWTWDYYKWTAKDERSLKEQTSAILKDWAWNPWNKETHHEKHTSSNSPWECILAQNGPPLYSDQFHCNTQGQRISLASSSAHHKLHWIPLMQTQGAVASVYQMTVNMLKSASKNEEYKPLLIVTLPSKMKIEVPD